MRDYQTRETSVRNHILAEFPEHNWICNRKFPGGTSRRRPDLLVDLGTHCVIVEIDENQHRDYTFPCEENRLNEIYTDVGFRKLVFVRFNPDGYLNEDGERVTSCWSHDGMRILRVAPTRRSEWVVRLAALSLAVRKAITASPVEQVEQVHLFFDKTVPANDGDDGARDDGCDEDIDDEGDEACVDGCDDDTDDEDDDSETFGVGGDAEERSDDSV